MLRKLFAFPNPVNEHAARFTAGLVVLLSVATIVASGPLRLVLVSLLMGGFILRVAGGPRYSPMGRLSVHVLVPLLDRKPAMTAGPPKRFAQAIGLAFSATALILTLLGQPLAATVVLVVLAAAATLESVVGFCLGCWLFSWLMRWGVIPEHICEQCANITRRHNGVVPADLDVRTVNARVELVDR